MSIETEQSADSQQRPPFGDLPLSPPPNIASLGVFGASAVFAALSIGSGEMMFWPALMLTVGAGVLWTAIIVVVLQWFINIEIARYSLATGNTMGFGIARRAPAFAVVLLFAAVLPWIWPGWVRAGGQLISSITHLPEAYVSLGILAVCILALTLPRVIYPFIEKAQSAMLALIFAGVIYLFATIATSQGGLGEFAAEFLGFTGVHVVLTDILHREDAAYFTLLSGIVFAGAGGILNLGYGYMVAERRYARARKRFRQAGIGRTDVTRLTDDEGDRNETMHNWSRWITTLRIEHALLFAGGNIASIIFISAMFFMLLHDSGQALTGITLLADVFQRLQQLYGAADATVFAIVGFLVFFTSALGILDLTSRISADIVSGLNWNFRLAGLSRYHIFVLGQGCVSAILIFLDPRQPFWLLASSAVLNTAAMAVYSIAIVWLNRRELAPSARAPLLVEAVVCSTGIVFAAAFLWTLYKVFL